MKNTKQTICPICGRGPRVVVKRSKSMRAHKVRQYLNLQKTEWQGKKILACTKCIRTMNKIKR